MHRVCVRVCVQTFHNHVTLGTSLRVSESVSFENMINENAHAEGGKFNAITYINYVFFGT